MTKRFYVSCWPSIESYAFSRPAGLIVGVIANAASAAQDAVKRAAADQFDVFETKLAEQEFAEAITLRDLTERRGILV